MERKTTDKNLEGVWEKTKKENQERKWRMQEEEVWSKLCRTAKCIHTHTAMSPQYALFRFSATLALQHSKSPFFCKHLSLTFFHKRACTHTRVHKRRHALTRTLTREHAQMFTLKLRREDPERETELKFRERALENNPQGKPRERRSRDETRREKTARCPHKSMCASRRVADEHTVQKET